MTEQGFTKGIIRVHLPAVTTVSLAFGTIARIIEVLTLFFQVSSFVWAIKGSSPQSFHFEFCAFRQSVKALSEAWPPLGSFKVCLDHHIRLKTSRIVTWRRRMLG